MRTSAASCWQIIFALHVSHRISHFDSVSRGYVDRSSDFSDWTLRIQIGKLYVSLLQSHSKNAKTKIVKLIDFIKNVNRWLVASTFFVMKTY